MKLEDMKMSAYGQLAYYAIRAIQSRERDIKDDYVRKIGVALCVLDGVGLLDSGDFIILQNMRYSNLEGCFKYVNNKAGNWYEL